QISIVANVTYTAGGTALAYVRKPDGTQLASFFIINGSGFLDSTSLPVTGTYTVDVQPTTSGTTTLTVFSVTKVALTTSEGGNALMVATTIPGQNAVITFTGSAGDYPSLAISGSSYSNCSLTVYRPDASVLTGSSCSSATHSLGNFTQNGTYKIVV